MPRATGQRKRHTRRKRTELPSPSSAQTSKETTRQKSSSNPRSRSARQSIYNLTMAALVALGCWGFAFTFTFLTNDPNRYLLGGLAALLALMWSVNFGIRFRKWQQQKS